MTRLPAAFLIWLLCPVAAVFAGYMLATPLDVTTLGTMGLILMLLLTPLFLKWHHDLLILSWNSFFIAFFLPGEPALGILMAVVSLFISVLTRTVRRQAEFIRVPQLTLPLVLLAIVVIVTAQFTGGIGARAIGSASFGGKRYLTLIGAIIGYFAFTAVPIPKERANRMAALFFLSGLSGAMSDVIYAAGPSFYFLFILFSANLASLQALSQDVLVRFSGLAWGSLAFCNYWLMRHGVAGVLNLARPWRLAAFVGALAIGLLGGFRSTLVVLGLLLVLQFTVEGLFRTRYFPMLVVFGLLAGMFVTVFAERMPLAVQRSISFLPIDVHPTARHDARSTLDWRLQMWKIVLPEVPKYLWVGKGFSFSGTDMHLTQEAVARGYFSAYEDTLISGNYHNGILTTIIPFGLPGLLAFLWFVSSAVRVLYRNHRYSDPDLQKVNTFLFVFFVARLIFFFTLYGQLELDLMLFTGCVGLSISLNHGVRSPVEAPDPLPASLGVPRLSPLGA